MICNMPTASSPLHSILPRLELSMLRFLFTQRQQSIGKWLRYSENQAVAAGSSWVTEKKSFDIEEAGIVTLILIAPRLLLGEGRKK